MTIPDAGFDLSKIANEAWIAFLLGTWVGYVAALILGVPLYFLLWYLRWVSLASYLAMGFLLGLVVFEATWPGAANILIFQHWDLLLSPELWSVFFPAVLQYELPCGFAGACAAAVFWFLVKPQPRAARIPAKSAS